MEKGKRTPSVAFGVALGFATAVSFSRSVLHLQRYEE